MFRSLGDFIIISNVASRIKRKLKDAEIVIFHRNNPYLKLLDKDYLDAHFFKTRSPVDIIRLAFFLRAKRKRGYSVFGLQQVPGSLLGSLALSGLKSLRAIDYVADFNLCDADMITVPKGDFIFARHLLQLEDIFNFKFEQADFNLELPFKISDSDRDYVDKILPADKRPVIALHPWSGKRNSQNHAWDTAKCLELAGLLNKKFPEARIAVLGIGRRKEAFCKEVLAVIGPGSFLDVPRLAIPQLAYLFKKAAIFITANSGPMHLAYIQKTKMVVLSGPSLAIWNPPGAANIKVLKPKGDFFPPAEKEERAAGFPAVSDIETEDVFKAACELWSN